MDSELYVAESLLQVLSSVCIAFDGYDCVVYKTLIINGRFAGADQIASRINNTKLFNEVILVSPQYEEDGASGLSAILETASEQKARFSRILSYMQKRSGYQRLYFAGPNQLTRDAKRFCLESNGKASLIDDGSGSHNAAIAKTFSLFDDILNESDITYCRRERVKSFFKRIFRTIAPSRGIFGVDSIYLFNPSERDAAHFKNVQIRSLDCSNPSVHKYVAEVFKIANKDSPRPEIVMLSMPDFCSDAYKKNEHEVLAAISISGLHAQFRPHPRKLDFSDVPDSFDIDQQRDFWEASWMLGIYDEHTALIGAGSTALLTPKIMFDKEPFVIFTHRLVNDGFDKNSEESYEDILDRYTNKYRVIAPKTINELEDALDIIGRELKLLGGEVYGC